MQTARLTARTSDLATLNAHLALGGEAYLAAANILPEDDEKYISGLFLRSSCIQPLIKITLAYLSAALGCFYRTGAPLRVTLPILTVGVHVTLRRVVAKFIE